MKLKIEVSDVTSGMKIERTFHINSDTVSNHDTYGKVIEEMYEAIEDKKYEILEMTKHND